MPGGGGNNERQSCLIVIPAKAGMYGINHWIPAFAGRLRASSAACSRRRSTTYIPVGVPSRRIQDFLSINDNGGDRRIMSDTNHTMARITDALF